MLLAAVSEPCRVAIVPAAEEAGVWGADGAGGDLVEERGVFERQSARSQHIYSNDDKPVTYIFDVVELCLGFDGWFGQITVKSTECQELGGNKRQSIRKDLVTKPYDWIRVSMMSRLQDP